MFNDGVFMDEQIAECDDVTQVGNPLDGATEQRLHGPGQTKELADRRHAAAGLELDQEVGITVGRMEVAPRAAEPNTSSRTTPYRRQSVPSSARC